MNTTGIYRGGGTGKDELRLHLLPGHSPIDLLEGIIVRDQVHQREAVPILIKKLEGFVMRH